MDYLFGNWPPGVALRELMEKYPQERAKVQTLISRYFHYSRVTKCYYAKEAGQYFRQLHYENYVNKVKNSNLSGPIKAQLLYVFREELKN